MEDFWLSKKDMSVYKFVNRQKISQFRKEIISENPEFVKDARRAYLIGKKESLLKKLRSWKLLIGRLTIKEKNKNTRFWLERMALLSPYEKQILDTERDIMHLERVVDNVGMLKEEDIHAARGYPLHRILGLKDSDRIPCPLHGGKDKNMTLRGGFGYCFVCNGRMDSIEYLRRERGLNFPAAVKEILGYA